ncbi:hypothetical protein V8E55_006935 [Tylopilus felleus]
MREIPSIKTLIDNPSHGSTLKTVLKRINEAISETQSSDSARLREKLPTYILLNPKVDTMKPIINVNMAKSELGLNHVQLAGFLCPVESVLVFNENTEETCEMLENGKINMSATELPAFLWEDNRAKYNDEDIYLGLFYGFYLERVARHIYTGPSTAHGGDPRGVRLCNAALHRMEKAEAAHIAYAAVLARFEISSHTRWAEKDAHFNYCNFYYIVMDLIDECKDVKWRETLLKHYNMLFFKNEEGRGDDSVTAGDENSTSVKSGGLLSRMRAQAAARAAKTINIPSAQATIPTPPDFTQAFTSRCCPRGRCRPLGR